MATMTASELLDWLGKSLLLPGAQVDELRLTPPFADSHSLAKELIKRNWLTPYQVNQILQGKGDSLILGGNRLLERLGEGSMGQVFKAWSTRLGRVVAVKMVHKEYFANNKAMDRFRREVETASQLDHPNIVLVRDADIANDRPFMVMDFIVGDNLSHRVKQYGPLGLGEAVEYARQAALGLQHAYERGVVHRDIKPSNLLLTKGADQAPLVKILDFGLARFDSEERNDKRLTFSGNLLGTVDYIAPEQAQDAHTADIRADIYSLGCTLYYLLTAKPPFPGATMVEKITARTGGAPPSVRTLRSDVPAGLDAVLQRMMARSADERFQTPAEVAAALAPFTKLTGVEHPTAQLTVADLQAAPTARQLAQAIPVTQPWTAPAATASVPVVQAVPIVATSSAVAKAMPVAQPIAAGSVPVVQAIPVAATPLLQAVPLAPTPMVEAVPVDNNAGGDFFQNAADTEPPAGIGTPFDDPTSETAPTSPASISVPARSAPSGSSRKLVWWVGGGIGALAGLIVALIIFWPSNGAPSGPSNARGYPPGAELHLRPLEPRVLKEGDRKNIIVNIQRKDFFGPVRVFFEGLPDGFSAKEITLTDKQVESQLYLTVSFGVGAQQQDLRLVAVAENLRDSTTLSVTVESNRNDTPVQKQRPISKKKS